MSCKKDISSLYCLKALGMVFVLLIHFRFPEQKYLEPIYKSGVYIFFVISGYFLYTGDTLSQIQKIERNILKVLKLTLSINSLYFILEYVVNDVVKIKNRKDLIQWFLYGDQICGILWYLQALLGALCLLWIIKKLNIQDLYFVLVSVVLWVYAIVSSDFFLVVKNSFLLPILSVPNLLGLSFPYIAAGILIRKYYSKLSCINAWWLVFFAVLIAYGEHRILSWLDAFNLTLIFGAMFIASSLLLLALKYPNLGRDSYFGEIGQMHSANIYFWQYVPYFFLTPLLDKYNWMNEYSVVVFFMVLLAMSYLINYFKRITGVTWI